MNIYYIHIIIKFIKIKSFDIFYSIEHFVIIVKTQSYLFHAVNWFPSFLRVEPVHPLIWKCTPTEVKRTLCLQMGRCESSHAPIRRIPHLKQAIGPTPPISSGLRLFVVESHIGMGYCPAHEGLRGVLNWSDFLPLVCLWKKWLLLQIWKFIASYKNDLF